MCRGRCGRWGRPEQEFSKLNDGGGFDLESRVSHNLERRDVIGVRRYGWRGEVSESLDLHSVVIDDLLVMSENII